MTEKPEDYAQPKYRQDRTERVNVPPAPEPVRQRINEEHEAELVRKVEGALSEVKQAEQSGNTVQDFAALGSNAVLKYGEASAKTCEQTGDEVMQDAERLRNECYQLAEDIRYVARVQAQAVQRAMERNKEAALGVTALRKAFHADLSREREEVEATKQRATSS